MFGTIVRGIFSSFGIGFLTYITVIVILIILYRKGLLKRVSVGKKFLVVLYWILIPVICATGVSTLLAISYAQESAEEISDAALNQFEKYSFPIFHKNVSENIESFGNKVLTNEELVDTYAVGESGEIAGGWISKSMMIWFLDFAIELGEEKLADQIGTEKETVHAVRLFKAEGVDQIFSGAFERLQEEAHGLIKGLFAPYFWGTIVVLFVLLIYPIIEVFSFWRKKKKGLIISE